MTPHERLIIALRHGVLVRRTATMRYSASVAHHSARRAEEDRFNVASVEAVSAIEAARKVAEIAAVRRYDEDGSVGYVSPSPDGTIDVDEYFFLAAIGTQQRSADGITLAGVTISIHVWLVD
jgi:hypothetical protein